MSVEIVRKADGKLVAYACPSCGILYSILEDTDQSRANALQGATTCCPARLCSVCGKNPVDRATPICSSCSERGAIVVEQERFAAAVKVPEASWTGPVYWPNAPFTGDHGGFYWSSVAALRQDIVTRNSTRTDPTGAVYAIPPYVYATKPIPFRVIATAAVEVALADHSDAVVIDAAQVQLLQQQMDAWAVQQNVQSYEEDLRKAIVLT